MRFLHAIAICAGVLAIPSTAVAARPTLVILPVDRGDFPKESVEGLDRAIRQEIARSLPGVALLATPALDFSSMQLAAGCEDDGPKCLASIGRTLGATRIVYVAVRGTRARATLHVAAVTTKSEKAVESLIEAHEFGLDSRGELAWRIARALGSKRAPPPGKIVLSRELAELALTSEVFIDDVRVDSRALEHVVPGERRLELRREGYESFRWVGEVPVARIVRVAGTMKARPRTSEKLTVVPRRTVAADSPPDSDLSSLATPSIAAPSIAAPSIAPGDHQPSPPPVVGDSRASAEVPSDRIHADVPVESRSTMGFTIGFGAATVVAAAAATWASFATIDQVDAVREQGLACGGKDREDESCARGRTLETLNLVGWAATGAFGIATVIAFFLEGGADLFADDASPTATSADRTPNGDVPRLGITVVDDGAIVFATHTF